MKRRLVAILAADVAGYTRLVERDTDGTVAAWQAVRTGIVDPAVSEHAGRIVKLTGDGFLVEFSTVQDAVECATRMQVGLRDNFLDFRMGINLGDIVDDGEDIHGEGVNIAARIEALAQPGGICISGDVYNQVRNRLAHRYEDMGEIEVKHVSTPVRVYRLVGLGSSEPPPEIGALCRPEKPSIAVLPFDNMSGDPEQQYFADGLTDDIITDLSRFQGLFVIARNTTFTYKGQELDAPRVAADLGVQFVLEGSVRKAGDRVRITARLIDGDNGRHIWAERYDGKLEDVFDLQEDVTRQVVGSVAPQIDVAELDRADRGMQRFDEAHDLGWRSLAKLLQARMTANVSQVEEVIGLARRALTLNDKCAIAYQSLVTAYVMLHIYSWGDNPAAAAERALDYAKAAMSALPQSETAYMCLGAARWSNGDHEQAARDLRCALDLNPNSAYTLIRLALCEAAMGDAVSAREHATDALRLNPKDRTNHVAHLPLAMAAFLVRDHAAFLKWGELAIQAHPVAPIRRALMIAYAAEIGDEMLLHTHLDELNRFAPDFIPSLFRGENRIFTKDEHMDMLLDGLRKAGLPDS